MSILPRLAAPWRSAAALVAPVRLRDRGRAADQVADAVKFVDEAEARLLELAEEAGRAEWVQNTYITDDTEVLAAAGQRAR